MMVNWFLTGRACLYGIKLGVCVEEERRDGEGGGLGRVQEGGENVGKV